MCATCLMPEANYLLRSVSFKLSRHRAKHLKKSSVCVCVCVCVCMDLCRSLIGDITQVITFSWDCVCVCSAVFVTSYLWDDNYFC